MKSFIFYLDIFLLFVLSLIVMLFPYHLMFYVHEYGHVSFAHLTASEGENIVTNFTNYKNFLGLKLPQRTVIVEGKPTLGFTFGGIILSGLVSLIFYTLIYFFILKWSKRKEKTLFFFPLFQILYDLFGNNLCGTDNTTGQPIYSLCQSSFITWVNIIFGLILPAIVLTYLLFKFLKKKNSLS